MEDWYRQDVTHVIHECTRTFDITSLREAVGDKYLVQQVIWCPRELGIPSHRTRSYIVMTLKSAVVVDVEWSRMSLSELHFVELKASARIYFRVPASVLKRFYEQHQQADAAEHGGTEARSCLTQSALNRLDEHVAAAVVADSVDFIAIAHNQNRSFMAFDSSCPALTRTSKIWGYSVQQEPRPEPLHGSAPRVLDRMMLPAEYLCALGWPCILEAGHRDAVRLPMCFTNPYLLGGDGIDESATVSESEIQHLAGNSMHVTQILTALAHIVLGTHLQWSV